MEVETKMCSNCMRDISVSNFVMHEMHCRRHIAVCQHCKEPIPRTEMEQHFNDLHAMVPCEKCKQDVAKENMEKHMTSECERRPVQCEYCELSFPKSEFETHVDFCGSRTECCVLCRQYVMLKDMLRHENSGCTYPPQKPAPQPQPASQAAGLDRFSMPEMYRLLGAGNFVGQNVFVRNGESIMANDQGDGARSDMPPRLLNRDSRRESARKKTDVNIQRANNLSSQLSGHNGFEIPPDMDYDTMLALQLAHDDWLQDGEDRADNAITVDANPDSAQFEDYLWDIDPAEMEQRPRDSRNPEEANEATIPCEFCEEEVPLESYMHHMEHCSSSNVHNNNATQQDLNNGVLSPSLATGRPSIPVINNLGTPSSMQRNQDLSHDYEDVMLPCEFCEEIYPSEIIIQHQSVCQANGMVTPRVMTPASGPSGLRTERPPPALGTFPSNGLTSHSVGQRSELSHLNFISDLEAGLVEEYFAADSGVQCVPESSSNKYSAPIDRFDDAIARPPRRASKPSTLNSPSEHQASGGAASGAMRHAKRENSSAQRARARLNQLLQEDEGPSSTGSGGIASNGVRGVNTDRKTNVDSRSVMRQLDAARVKSTNKNRPGGNTGSQRSQGSRRQPMDSNISRNNSSSSNGGASNHTPAAGARSRQRADHVFSPELRLKPDHNPRPRKQ